MQSRMARRHCYREFKGFAIHLQASSPLPEKIRYNAWQPDRRGYQDLSVEQMARLERSSRKYLAAVYSDKGAIRQS